MPAEAEDGKHWSAFLRELALITQSVLGARGSVMLSLWIGLVFLLLVFFFFSLTFINLLQLYTIFTWC